MVAKIKALQMQDNQKITKFVVVFNRLAKPTGWNEVALCDRFYAGLPTCLKDKISDLGKSVKYGDKYCRILVEEINGLMRQCTRKAASR